MAGLEVVHKSNRLDAGELVYPFYGTLEWHFTLASLYQNDKRRRSDMKIPELLRTHLISSRSCCLT